VHGCWAGEFLALLMPDQRETERDAEARHAARLPPQTYECRIATIPPIVIQGRSARPSFQIKRSSRRPLDKVELQKLQAFLRQAFGNSAIRVAPAKRNPDNAEVHLGERQIGSIVVDDEDGDRSFAFDMKIPVERPVLQEYLRRLFENDKLKIVARAKKTDSVELNSGDDFLGVISADDPKGKSYTLQIAILDFDLEDF
jgi:uncharacterized protein DUF3126